MPKGKCAVLRPHPHVGMAQQLPYGLRPLQSECSAQEPEAVVRSAGRSACKSPSLFEE